MMRYVVGLDLGTRQDYSALVVEEHSVERGDTRRPEHRHDVRHLERFPLGTGYVEVVRRVVNLVTRPPLSERAVVLAVDATGVGRPIVETLACELPIRRSLTLLPITITGGDAPTSHTEGSRTWWSVPKRDLVSSVALALEQEREGDPDARRLQVAPSLHEARALVDELRAFRVTISDSAHDTYGAWRERDHDDLVLAVACAVWAAEREWQRPVRFKVSRPKGVLPDIDPRQLLGDYTPRMRGW